MSPSRVAVCVWIAVLLLGADLVYCQGSSKQANPISCELNGRSLRNNETIHYKHGDQSIVICKVRGSRVTLEPGHMNISGMLKKRHRADVIGILLSHAPNHINLHAVKDARGRNSNTIGEGFHLNFEGTSSPGHQPELCKVDPPELGIEAQLSDQIQCLLNNVALMNLSTIHVTGGCQLNIVRCSVDQSDFAGHFEPEQYNLKPAAWIHHDATSLPHIIFLQLKDIISDSDTEVRINKLLQSTANTSPFPFIFTVVNKTTDPTTPTTTMNVTIDITAPTATTGKDSKPGVSDSNTGLSSGGVVGAVLVGLLIVASVIMVGVMLVCYIKRKRMKQSGPSANPESVEEGDVTHRGEGGDVLNQSGDKILPDEPNPTDIID